VGEIEGLAGREALLDQRPDGALGGVGDEHLDDGPALGGLFMSNSVLPGTQRR